MLSRVMIVNKGNDRYFQRCARWRRWYAKSEDVVMRIDWWQQRKMRHPCVVALWQAMGCKINRWLDVVTGGDCQQWKMKASMCCCKCDGDGMKNQLVVVGCCHGWWLSTKEIIPGLCTAMTMVCKIKRRSVADWLIGYSEWCRCSCCVLRWRTNQGRKGEIVDAGCNCYL